MTLPSFYSVAAVKDIDRYQEKITVSLHQASLSSSTEHIKLGVLASDELPKHYRWRQSQTKALLNCQKNHRTVWILSVAWRLCVPSFVSLSLRAATDGSQTYEYILTSCHGYHNPSVVNYLLEKEGISDTHPPSVMRGLQRSVLRILLKSFQTMSSNL